jgi:hypothetical protein
VSNVLHSQQLVYESKKELDYYFDKSDSQNDAVFSLLGDNLSSGAYFKYQLNIQVEVYKQQNKYPVKIKAVRDNVECRYRYRGFLVSDFIIADKISIQGNLTSGQASLMNFSFNEKEIPLSNIILDTVLISDLELGYFHSSISEIRLFLGEKSITHLKEGFKTIDDFFRCDSLYADWDSKIEGMDLSNVDRIPVYQFQLDDIEQEVLRYDKNEYEILLSRSGIDNQDYLHKRSVLFNRISERKLEISKKMAVMDQLMYEEGKHFEEENDLQKAIFYYVRTLDYNPLHCEALEKLSDLYLQNNLHQQNLDLFTGLKVRGEDIICESTLTSSVCDSMCMKVNQLIINRNYYDALKFLDTLELMIYQISDTSYMQIYYNLKKQAQEGIYDSYFEVIGRAIKNNKLDLGKEYIYGLTDIMQNDGNNVSENPKYMQMMERFLSRYMDNIRNSFRKRNYDNIVSGNDAMILFLDSIAYSYEKEMFKDSYTKSHTALYIEKKKHSEADAFDYLKIYSKYIAVADEPENIFFEDDNGIIAADYGEDRCNLLIQYILRWDESNDDFSVLDTLIELFQMEKCDDQLYDITISRQTTRIVSEAVSKINQYAWSNELLKASALIGKTDNILPFFNLQQTDSALFLKYNQTKDLLLQRFSQQAEQEYTNLAAKVEKLTNEKDYLQAYNLLQKEDVFLKQTIYQAHLERLKEQIRIPATFQQKMFTAQQDFLLGDFIEGFIFYEDAYNYFEENNVTQYDLACDQLLVFVKKRNQNDFLKSAVIYFMNNNDYANAMDVMMYAASLGYANEDLQMQLGKKMKSVSYNFDSLKEKYTFTKVHKPFLKSFLGGFNAFWYNVKQLFKKKN